MGRTLREWVLRCWGTLSRHRSDTDLEEELRLHQELAAEDAGRRGHPPHEAGRAARLRTGGALQAMDALRDQRGLPWVDAGLSGISTLPRLVSRHRGYFAFATMTLALAVGVNLVVFTVVNALWLRPLPFPDADRVVLLQRASVDQPWLQVFGGGVAGQVMTDDFHPELSTEFLRPQIRFEQIGRSLETLAVTPGYFHLFRLAIRGRDFTSDDNRPGAEPVAIISDRLWSREFARRHDVIGAVIAAEPVSIRLIGVAPPGFEGARRGEKADMWIPASLVPRVVRAKVDDSNPLMVFARLAPGQTIAGIDRFVREEYPRDALKEYLMRSAVALKDVFGTPTSRTIVINEGNSLAIVGGLAMLVLLGGCATLATLVLVHYERRRGELAVRLALGASRLRLAGELARELLLLAAGGTLGAVVVATWGLRVIASLSLAGGVDLGRLDLSLDWRVLAAAVATTLLTLLVAAWLPVSRFTRAGLARDLVAGPAPTPSPGSQRTRQGLLALHVSATVVVLIAAGLFVRAVVHGFGSGPGFDVDHTLFVSVELWNPMRPSIPLDHMEEFEVQGGNRVGEALRSVPGVDEAAQGQSPISDVAAGMATRPIVVRTEGGERSMALGSLDGSPNLLSTLGVPIVAGRGLTPADATAQPIPTVVTASLARMLWPDGNPLGRVVSTGRRGGRLLVVGIARDFVFGTLTRPASGIVVTARGGYHGINCEFTVRARHSEAIVKPILEALEAAMPDATSIKAVTGRDIVARDLGRQRLGAWFFSGFGLVALLLGVLGVFGLVAYLAESRQREFGIRLALGATWRDLVRQGLAAAIMPVSAGLAAGLVCAAWVSRLFTSLLAGLSALDPLTYVAVAGAMVACATLAGLGGAWRLRRMAPVDALRAE